MHCMHPEKRANYVVSWLYNQPSSSHALQESNLTDADYTLNLGAIVTNGKKINSNFSGKS